MKRGSSSSRRGSSLISTAARRGNAIENVFHLTGEGQPGGDQPAARAPRS